MAEHSKMLSPSASHIWMHCTAQPQAVIEADIPRTTNEAAERGTVQHEWCERIKKGEWDVLDLPPKDPLWETQEDWIEAWSEVQTAIDAVNSLMKDGHDVKAYYEMRVRLDNGPTGEEYSQCFGTSDVIIFDFTDQTLHVVDYKFGRVEVSEKMNSQLMIYGLAAIDAMWDKAPMDMARLGDNFITKMVVIQPKIRRHPAIFDMWKAGLSKWLVEELRPAMDDVLDGTGEFSPGPWCKASYCDLRHDGMCPALRGAVSQSLENFMDMMGGQKVTPPVEEHHSLARKLVEFEAIIKEIIADEKAKIFTALKDGEFVEGMKLVRGRGKRAFRSTEEAKKFFKGKLKLDEHSPRVMLTAPKTEKALKKAEKWTDATEKRFNELVEHIPGELTVAIESDPRKAVELENSTDGLLESFKSQLDTPLPEYSFKKLDEVPLDIQANHPSLTNKEVPKPREDDPLLALLG